MKLDTIRKVFDADVAGELVLPDFQREFVWKRDQQRKLLSTILVKIPINSMLILEGKSGSFAEKRMCKRGEAKLVEDGYPRGYLLDGQQRLSTLKSAFCDLFHDCDNWKDELGKLESNLNFRWFLNVKVDEKDLFGLKYLNFPSGEDNAISVLEPQDVEEYIESVPVFKKSEKEWISPSLPKADFIKECANRHYVPLFMMYYDEQIVSKILNLIQFSHINKMQVLWNSLTIEEKRKIGENACVSVEDWLEEAPLNSNFEWNNMWSTLGNTWAVDFLTYLKSILESKLTFITLNAKEISRAIVIFENLNNSGTALSTFDLLVARAAKYDTASMSESLVTKVYSVLKNNVGYNKSGQYDLERIGILDSKDKKMTAAFKNAYLNMLSLVINIDDIPNINKSNIKKNTYDVLSCLKQNKILQLDGKDIHERTTEVIISLLRAITFLNRRCGVCKLSELNYKGMLIPIAYLLRKDNVWNDESKLAKIEYWYWVSLFGGRYINSQNEVTAGDVVKLYNFVEKYVTNHFEDSEENILDFNSYSDYNTLIKPEDVPSAIKNGISAFVLSRKPHDFISTGDLKLSSIMLANGENYPADIAPNDTQIKLELHHIIPLGVDQFSTVKEATSKLRNDKKHILNSPLNLTYISDIANKKISTQAPDHYLKQLYSGAITDHCIPAKPNNSALKSEQEKFLKARYTLIKEALEKHIEELKNKF